MGISGITSGFSPAYGAKKTNSYTTGDAFAKYMTKAADQTGMQNLSRYADSRPNAGRSALAAYGLSSIQGADCMGSAYEEYRSENYKIVPDNESGCFDIYNKQGEKIGVFAYADIRVRQDAATGKAFLISEHGTACYDAVVLDGELQAALQKVMGKEALETEPLKGFTLHTHAETGIQFLVKDGEEGRGGKVLLQSEADEAKYEALAQTYLRRYPNLVHDAQAAYIWADLEIKGLARRTNQGIVSMGYDGMAYHDNTDFGNNWRIDFSADTYRTLYEYLERHRLRMEEMEQFSVWQNILDSIGSNLTASRNSYEIL